MGGIQRRLLKTVLAIVAHPRIALAVCALALAATVTLALFRLRVNTDQDNLFSSKVQFFKDFLEFERQFPENEALYVLIEPANPDQPPPLSRWTAVAEQISARMTELKGIVKSAQSHTPLDQLGLYGPLFLDRPQLIQTFDEARTQLAPLVQLWDQQPGMLERLVGRSPLQRFLAGLSLTKADPQQAQFAKLLADSCSAAIQTGSPQVPNLTTLQAKTPLDLGYDYVTDETNPSDHLLLVPVYLNDDDSTLAGGANQVDAVRATAAAVAKDNPDFHIGVTGRPALDADEMRTSDYDSTRAEILAMIVIFAGLVYFLRSFWMAAVAEISLAVAIGWTFGWATLSVGELNILSLVFLITLIGIGMDYLVQILTRYRREAALYHRPKAIWARVFRHVSPPICTACLGAAGAFFVSIFSDFRGATELGIIAGGGLLLCLTAGYTVLPALLVLFPPKQKTIDPRQRYHKPPHTRSGWRWLIAPAIWMLAFVLIVPNARKTYFNPNLLDMQAQNLQSVQLVRKLQTWFAVVISPDLDLLRESRAAIAASPTVASTNSILEAQDNYTWLQQHQSDLPAIAYSPPDDLTAADIHGIASAAAKLAAHYETEHYTDTVNSLRHFASLLSPPAAAPLSRWQLNFYAELKTLRMQFSPPPLDVQMLPDQLRNHLVSKDGYYALYVSPRQNLWQRQPLADFVNDVESRLAKIPHAPALTGIAPEIYHSTESIERSFYRSTAYAMAVVLILVFLDLRSIPQTLVTVSVLGLGLPMLVGLMGIFGVNWNFANFFGLPILIGAGHEYGVFMMHRYREVMHDPRRTWVRWDVSDRALLLCAFVTTSSFAFFWWLGHHEGLKSLGLVMAMGTTCIYLAALLVVRPVLKWHIERAGHSHGKSAAKNES